MNRPFRGLSERAHWRRPPWRLSDVIGTSNGSLWLLVLGVGLVAGLVGAGYLEALKYLTRLLGPAGVPRPTQLVVLGAVGATIGVLTLALGSPGNVELLVDNIHVTGGRSDLRELRSLIPISLLGIGAGSAIGPEAPLVQTTGSLGSWLALRGRVGVSEARILTITGMAAGFTVLFGAPLGSAIFALEILHRRGLQYYEALVPAAIGSLAGYVVYAGVTRVGFHAVWHFPAPASLNATDFAVGVGAGVAAALVAGLFTLAAQLWRRIFQLLPMLSRPVVGGLALGGLAFLSPYALTYGEGQIQTVASTAKLAVATLLLAVLAKFLASSMIVSSGWRGGFIIPMFFLGVALGSAGHEVLGVHRVVAMAAMMAAVNVGVTKTPFGSTLVVAEMAGLRLLPPVLLASIVSLFLSSPFAMIETQRARDPMATAEPSGDGPEPATS